MSSYYQGLAAGQRFRAEQEDRQEDNASDIINNISRYTQNLVINPEDGTSYKDISPEKFNELIGLKIGEDGTADYSGMKSLNEDFVQVNNNDLVTSILNSLSVSRLHTDQDGNTKKGEVVGVRINKNNGAIHYDLKVDQRIVPKTLGFSNDPKDIIMSSDLAGFRGIVNTAVRQTFRNSRQGAEYGRASVLSEAKKEFGTNLANEREAEQDGDAVDTINILNQEIEAGNIPLLQGANEIIQIGTLIQDELDAFNASQTEKTEQARRETEGETITREEADEIIDKMSGEGGFFDQPASVQRQIIRLRGPSNFITTKTGINIDEQRALLNAEPSQRYTREQVTEEVPVAGLPDGVTMPETRSVTRLTDPTPDTITREGVEYQISEKPQTFRGTDLVFPMQGTREEITSFVENNYDELLRVGFDEQFLKDAQTYFNKYNVQSPEDMARLPDDPEIPFNRQDAALAYAIASANTDDPANFNKNFQSGLNFINTDDMTVSDRDVMDSRRGMEERERALQVQQDAIVAELRRLGKEDEAGRTEEFIEAGRKINYFVNYKGERTQYSATPIFNQNRNDLTALLQRILLTGGPNGTKLTFQPDGQIAPQGISAGARLVLTDQLGKFIGALAISKGSDQRGGFLNTGFLSNRDDYEAMVGDISSRVRLRMERAPNGQEQIKEVVILDPVGNQYIPVLSGNALRAEFPDAQSMALIMSVFQREN